MSDIEYISKNKAIKALEEMKMSISAKEYNELLDRCCDGWEMRELDFGEAVEAIEKMESVSITIAHGEWIPVTIECTEEIEQEYIKMSASEDENVSKMAKICLKRIKEQKENPNSYVCSVCGCPGDPWGIKTNFCSCCGAMMDGAKEIAIESSEFAKGFLEGWNSGYFTQRNSDNS